MNRIDNLTGVRAFAACWVVIFHLQQESASAYSLGSVVGHGWLGVDVFFVLSGLVLSIVYAPRLHAFSGGWYRKFLLRRFAKIYPLHLITFLMMVALILIGRHMHYQFRSAPENNGWTAVCNVLMIHALGVTHDLSWNMHSWSVSAEWFAYTLLLTPMLLFLRRWSPFAVLGLSALVWTGFLLLCRFGLHHLPDLTINGALRITPEFLCGYALYRLLPSIKVPGDLLTLSGFVLILMVCVFPNALFWLLMPGVMLLLAGAHRQGTVSNLLFGNRVCILIGEASYSIYLLQLFLLIISNVVLRRAHVQFHGALALMVELLLAGLTVVAGICCFLLVEEPLRQWILRRFSRRSERGEEIGSLPPPPVGADTQVASTIG